VYCSSDRQTARHLNTRHDLSQWSLTMGEDMGFNINRARKVHFTRMQKALEEGLKAIELANSPDEADAARLRAQRRMEELNDMWNEAFPKDETVKL